MNPESSCLQKWGAHFAGDPAADLRCPDLRFHLQRFLPPPQYYDETVPMVSHPVRSDLWVARICVERHWGFASLYFCSGEWQCLSDVVPCISVRRRSSKRCQPNLDPHTLFLPLRKSTPTHPPLIPAQLVRQPQLLWLKVRQGVCVCVCVGALTSLLAIDLNGHLDEHQGRGAPGPVRRSFHFLGFVGARVHRKFNATGYLPILLIPFTFSLNNVTVNLYRVGCACRLWP